MLTSLGKRLKKYKLEVCERKDNYEYPITTANNMVNFFSKPCSYVTDASVAISICVALFMLPSRRPNFLCLRAKGGKCDIHKKLYFILQYKNDDLMVNSYST